MAHHASTERNFRVSTEVIVAVVAAIILLVLGTMYLNVRSSAENNAQAFAHRCSEGSMPVALAVANGTSEQLAQDLVSRYRESQPRVDDHCIDPQLVTDSSQAAAMIATGTREGVEKYLASKNIRPAADTWSIATTTPVGLAYAPGKKPTKAPWAEQPVNDIVFPNPTVHPASFVAAAAITNNNVEAGKALLHDHPMGTIQDAQNDGRIIAATKEATPKGFTFIAPDDTVLPTFVIPLGARDGVTEDKARAGADFAKTVDTSKDGATDTSVKWASAAQIISEQFAQVPEESKGSVNPHARDTLLVLDGGNAMSGKTPEGHSFFSETVRISDPLLVSTSRSGASLALWTTDDSTLQPALTFNNDVEATRTVARELQPTGQALTRSDVITAVGYAASHAHDTQRATSIIIVAGDTDPDGMDDDFFRHTLETFNDPLVQIDIVTIGDKHDSVLDDFAHSTHGFVGQARVTHELADSLQKAFAVDKP